MFQVGKGLRDLEVKAAGLEISGDTEVMEVTKATGDALSHLEQTVDGFDGGISQAGFQNRPGCRGSVL
jgi:hypothetical protein